MCRYILLFFVLFIGIAVNAQTVNLHGKVADQAGDPIADAIVTLTGQDLKDTTGADGMYEIVHTEVAVLPELQPEHKNFIVDKGSLVFSLPDATPLKIEMFDVKGILLKRESMTNVPSGFYRFGIAENPLAAKVLIIRVVIGEDAKTFRYLPLQNGNYAINQLPADGSSAKKTGLMKIAAINDTLKITAEGYKEKVVAITSYEQELDITLDIEGGEFGTGSIGCGKDLTDLKSGNTYKITSAGLQREYIIDIPSNYDKNKPTRLIFGMHCMGSSMQGVVNEKYYSLKPLAQKDNVPVIFIAPQGYTDNSPWRVSDDKDHTFFADMLKLFKEKLCVDTTRIFCCGFSYGAMVSYSLSTDFQDQLRAVATYAPANWNIYLPTNTHKPIAYYQTTGTGDNLCSWVNSDARKEGGKYCVLQHLEDNGCPTPSNIPLANSGQHVKTEFSGCPEEYPVIFSSHNGGHQGTASDQGSSENWVAKETWELFMRF